MRTTQAKPTSLSLFVDALLEMERTAEASGLTARYALRAAMDAMDQSFQLASLLASGADPRSQEVRVPFKFVVGKLLQTNELLGLPHDSPEALCLDILQGGAEPS
jgi:hypothetical protein